MAARALAAEGAPVNVFGQLIQWFHDPSHWSGPDGVPSRVIQHIELSGAGVLIAVAVALPVGLYIGHTRRFEFVAVTAANLGRAIPSFAILSIVYQLVLNVSPKLAFGFIPTVVALTLLAVPPILTNTYVGIQNVDEDTVESARGMGMTGREVLGKLEAPLAAPLIVAGVRTAAVAVVATATLAALIGGGGLGRYIIDGFAQGDTPQVLAGAVLVAVLAILTEFSLGFVQRAATPRQSSVRRRTGRALPGPAPDATLP